MATPDDLAQLANVSPAGMAKMTVMGQFVWVNPAFERLTGYASSELCSLTWRDITPPHERATFGQMLSEVTSGQRQTFEMSKSYNRKNNGNVPVHVAVTQHKADGEAVPHLLMVATPSKPRRYASSEVLATADRARRGPISVLKENWRHIFAAVAFIASATAGWVVTVNTGLSEVQRNGDRISTVEATLLEILKRLPEEE